MCGIAGLFHRDQAVDPARLRAMSRLLRHRGPDDEGIVLADARAGRAFTVAGPDTPDEVVRSDRPYSPGRWVNARGARDGGSPCFSVGLVHRRLAILDLSPGGHGPMCDPAGELWITYNGEVYNHVELRAELEAAGVRFHTTSDTEVILAAYRRWGPECLRRFNGMFGFAIWDARERTLFCARDRLGVKPFLYQWDGRAFAFASEPKALVLTQPGRIRPRLEAIHDLIALDWLDHRTDTFFDGVQQLPPGHWLAIGEQGFRIERWWTIDPTAHAPGTPAEWQERFTTLFDESIALRLRADVEVGSCLSGGLDSSAVVTTAARQRSEPIHAFTSAYDEGPAFDERRYVRTVVEATGAESHVVVPTGDDFWEVFDLLSGSQDEPTAGPGLYSQWHVMALAHRAGLKVLLDGQGGDETLAGYGRHLVMRLRDLAAQGRPLECLRVFGAASRRLGATTTTALMLEPLLPSPLVAGLRRRFGQGKDRILSPALRAVGRDTAPPAAPRDFPSALSRQLAFDTLQRLLPSLLRYEDRNSMAHSIETRLPFLDYRLVEFAFALPDDQRLDGATSKAILRRSLADRIPGPVLARTDKMGFETPVDHWLRGRFARDARRRLLAPGPLHDWVSPPALAAELDDYLEGRRAIGLQVWRWLSLESWSRRFLASDPRVSRHEATFDRVGAREAAAA